MTNSANNIKSNESAQLEGLSDFFDEAPITLEVEPVTRTYAAPVADSKEPVTCTNEPVPGVPIEQAAQLLRVSINALKKRLRKGSLRGTKRDTKHGEKWFVDESELTQTQAPNAFKVEPVTGTSAAPVADSKEPVTCANEPVPTDIQHSELIAKIKELEFKLEGAAYRNGYLEAENDGLKNLLGAKDSHIKLLVDSQHKSSVWQWFKEFFFKQ